MLRNAQKTQSRLLDAAEKEFAAHGYQGTAIRKIIARARTNERMIYHYFGSKELLYRAVLLRRLHQVGTSLSQDSQAPVGPELDPRASLAEVLRRYFNALTSQPTLPRLLLHEALDGWKTFVKLDVQAPGDPLAQELVQHIQNAQQAGVFSAKFDARLCLVTAALMFICYPVSLPRVQLLFREPLHSRERLDWAREQFVDLLLNGLLSRDVPQKAVRQP